MTLPGEMLSSHGQCIIAKRHASASGTTGGGNFECPMECRALHWMQQVGIRCWSAASLQHELLMYYAAMIVSNRCDVSSGTTEHHKQYVHDEQSCGTVSSARQCYQVAPHISISYQNHVSALAPCLAVDRNTVVQCCCSWPPPPPGESAVSLFIIWQLSPSNLCSWGVSPQLLQVSRQPRVHLLLWWWHMRGGPHGSGSVLK